MLIEAAKDIGFKVYLVDLTRTIERTAVDWIDLETYDYDRYSEIEEINEAYVDEDGFHEIEYDELEYVSGELAGPTNSSVATPERQLFASMGPQLSGLGTTATRMRGHKIFYF
jgi:hypothetical protein